jgi:DNA modification methylase
MCVDLTELKIDKEYEKVVQSLADDEYTSLKKSIKNNGQQIPILVNPDGVILDGHHRFKICNELGITPKHEVRMFKNKLYEKLFVIDLNLQRRHLNTFQRTELQLLREPILKQIAEENRIYNLKQNQVRQNSSVKYFTLGRVNEKIGKQSITSHVTVGKVKTIIEKGPEDLIHNVRRGKISIDKAFRRIRNEEKKQQLEAKIASGFQLTEQERLRSLGIDIRPYNQWNFQLDGRYGKEYPGQIPAGIIFNTLYFFTEEDDLIIDPMSGGGVIGDVCKDMNRKCLMYDINPHNERNDIIKRDISLGLSEEAQNADLLFWDPPYWKKKEKEYDNPDGSIASLNMDQYMKIFENAAKDFYKKGIKKIAFLMSDHIYTEVAPNTFIWDYVEIFKQSGWIPMCHIHCPLSTEQVHNHMQLIETRKMWGISRSLVIFERGRY